MKKTLISILLILTVGICAVYAEGKNWYLSFSAGYDHQSCNDNASNSIGLNFAARTRFNSNLDVYSDFSVHGWGSFKFVDQNGIAKNDLKDRRLGYKAHLGFIYNIKFNKSEKFDLGIGIGAAFARSTASKGEGSAKTVYGFTNLGASFITVARYHVGPSFAFQAEFIPDFYFMHWNTQRTDHSTTIKDENKMGLGIGVKMGCAFSF